jgi:hypothetical protein
MKGNCSDMTDEKASTITLNPITALRVLYKAQKAKTEAARRRRAIYLARDAFAYFDWPLDELTDEEVEKLIRHSGEIGREMKLRKHLAITGLIEKSQEAINK